jgi:endonuclease YncB( thermonuclease family)
MGKSQRLNSGFHRLGVFVATLMMPAVTYGAELSGSADKIADGDTFWICDWRACHKIRLCGADAPEKGEPGYERSAQALRQLVDGKVVRCVQVGNGTPCDGRSKPTNYDRIVAQCFVEGTDIAVPMVEQGFACDWVKFSGGAYSQGGKGNRC